MELTQEQKDILAGKKPDMTAFINMPKPEVKKEPSISKFISAVDKEPAKVEPVKTDLQKVAEEKEAAALRDAPKVSDAQRLKELEPKEQGVSADLIFGRALTPQQRLAASMNSTGASNVGDLGDKAANWDPNTMRNASGIEKLGPSKPGAVEPVVVPAKVETPVVKAEEVKTDELKTEEPKTKESTFKDKLKSIGGGLFGLLEATGKGYVGDKTPTVIGKKYESFLSDREKELVAKLQAKRDEELKKYQDEATAAENVEWSKRAGVTQGYDLEKLTKQGEIEEKLMKAKEAGATDAEALMALTPEERYLMESE